MAKIKTQKPPVRKRRTARGAKGGEAALERTEQTLRRSIKKRPAIQNIVDNAVKTSKKIGVKGGVAALAGGAAGMAIGAIAVAAMKNNQHKTFGERVSELAETADTLREEIKKAQK